ncbi:oligosaccharide flippase family protein [uncultured Sphaerotilus sp.]|uniref:oligosaccharide flippase family protein n=1 Tax=uncultured Sphaerotilus sp. TaxID=474984 RepID=UPI0030CA5B18
MQLPLGNILFSALKIIVNQVLPIVILPYLLKKLGDFNFGLLMIAQTIALFGVTTVEYGFNLTGVRSVALVRQDPNRLLELYRDVNLVKLLFCLLCAVVLWFAQWLFSLDTDLCLAITAGFLMVLGSALQPNWFFMGMEWFRQISLVQIFSRATCLVLIFFLVQGEGDFLSALALFFAPTLLSGVLLLAAAQRHFSRVAVAPYRVDRPRLSRLVRDGVDVYLSQMAASLFISTNTLVLGVLSGPVDSGRYALAEKLMRGVAVLSTPVTEALFPRVVVGLQADLHTGLVFLRRVVLAGGLAFVVVAILSYVFFDFATERIGLSGGGQIKALFAVMAIVPGLIFLNNICGTQIVLGLGHARLFRNVVMVSGLSLVGCSWLFSWLWGAPGAAVALLTGEVVICVGMAWASVRVVGWNWFVRR